MTLKIAESLIWRADGTQIFMIIRMVYDKDLKGSPLNLYRKKLRKAAKLIMTNHKNPYTLRSISRVWVGKHGRPWQQTGAN